MFIIVFFHRDIRLNPLTDEKIQHALEADIPCGTEDDRFGLSGDSDVDANYLPLSNDESAPNNEISADDSDEPEHSNPKTSEI